MNAKTFSALAEPNIAELEQISLGLRRDIFTMIGAAGSGHPGGSLSAIDILTYLYFHRMSVRPDEPQWPDRDRFVLSKGHCAPAWYAALCGRGYFPREWLMKLRESGSPLQGHPDMNKYPGVDMTTGSLGQGFACAAGIALAGKVRQKDFAVYVMVSDGEIQEGVVWEAAMAAGNDRLDNLVTFVDDNKLQTDGRTADIMDPAPIAEKFSAFGWHTQSINGHDFAAIHRAAENCAAHPGRPHVIVADTIKGKGAPSLEGLVDSHSLGAAWTPEETAAKIAELEKQR